MPGVIQDNVSTSWPIEYNRRRLAGLRSSLKKQRQLLVKAGKNRPRRAKINESINATLEKLANELLNAGEYSEAYDLFFWLPENGKYAKSRYQGLADSLLRLKQFEEAVDIAENATRAYPDDIDLRITLLNALNAMSEYEKCLSLAYDSILLFPDQTMFAFFAAQSHEFLEHWDEAEERYQLILRENPEDAHLRAGIARCLMGKGHSKKAVPLLKRAVVTSPEYSGCYYELVNTYADLDQFDKALRVARRAFELFSDTEGLAYGYLGMALLNNDEEDEAIEILREGLLLYPEEDMIADILEDIED